ncbi:MAG: hypothetical protein IJN63_06870 [Clostridia bacterium]|nr:hypothetical protein [Clostridia bacterium]
MKDMNKSKSDINEAIEKLDWSYALPDQNSAVALLSSMSEQYDTQLIFDKKRKCTWENAVKVIELIGYPKNAALLHNIIWLLQDVNWPGALHGIEILAALDKRVVIPLIEEALFEADEKDDSMWIGGLKMLSNRLKLTCEDFSDAELWAVFTKADF